MIKRGMWFESKSHYEYYIRRTKEVRTAFDRLQSCFLDPLTKRVKELLNEQT